MRIIIYTIAVIFMLSNYNALAQTGVKFAFKGGYSMATQYGIEDPDIPYAVEVAYRHGFAVGFLAYYPITDYFGVQQEVLYVQKGSREDIKMLYMPVETHTEYDLNYFEIPITFRYTFARLWDIDIYGSTGFALSIMLDGEYRLSGQVLVEDGEESEPFSETSEIRNVDIFDYGFLYGAGIEFDLFSKKWFFEYRFNIAWNTLNMPTVEGGDPAPLRNMDYIFVLGMFI
jgi:hypothetical protein